MRRSQGFTLVELMVVVAIIGILAATSLPLGQSWVSEAKVTKVRGELSQALGKAKGLAIRNSALAVGDSPATAVCIGDDDNDVRRVTVLERTITLAPPAAPVIVVPNCGTGAGNTVWTSPISDQVTLTNSDGAGDFTCACYSGAGLLSNDGSCNVCANILNSPITLSAGNKDEQMLIH